MDAALEKARNVIEAGISQLGVALENCRTEDPREWRLKRGSADVIVRINDNPGGYVLAIVAPVMNLPQNNVQELALELLSLNHGFAGIKFTLYKDLVCLTSTRYIEGMDSKEFLDLLTYLGPVADHYDDVLKQKYSA